MNSRVSFLFAVTTSPTNTAIADAHSGGWSESVWAPTVISYNPGGTIDILAQLRAALLPVGASVIGYRVENFTIAGNKLLPGGANSGRIRYPGANGSVNIPQDALQLSGSSGAGINTNHFSLRGIPDGQIANGEFQPDVTYLGLLQSYINELTTRGWGFIGRTRSNTTARVNTIAGNVVTLSANIGGTVNQSFLRFLRVYDDNRDPIKGDFLISSIASNVYTVEGLAGREMSLPSGNARIDAIQYFQYNAINIDRAVARKIGSPFARYRGRASARR